MEMLRLIPRRETVKSLAPMDLASRGKRRRRFGVANTSSGQKLYFWPRRNAGRMRDVTRRLAASLPCVLALGLLGAAPAPVVAPGLAAVRRSFASPPDEA